MQEPHEELQVELRESVLHGNLVRLRELVLIRRFSVNGRDQDGRTPIILAAEYGHAQAALFLLQNGASVDATDNNGNTALGFAVRLQNFFLAQLLLQNGANVEALIRCGGLDGRQLVDSPIVWAISSGDHAMVGLLLQFGAKTIGIRCGATYRYSAFTFACGRSSLRVVQMLLDHEDGMGVNKVVMRGPSGTIPWTPLCEVCMIDGENRVEIAQFLIERGAQVIGPGDGENVPSPLRGAVLGGNLELLRLFLKHSPFSSTSKENPQTSSTQETDGAMYRPLTKPLRTALMENKLEAAQLLIDYGALKSGFPFLLDCAVLGDVEGTRMLLRAGANVNQHDERNPQRRRDQTPLWIAAKNGHSELVQELVQAKADVNIRDRGGETPLGVAYRMGHKAIVYLLLRDSPHVWMALKEVW